jgi:hypothetical protein
MKPEIRKERTQLLKLENARTNISRRVYTRTRRKTKKGRSLRQKKKDMMKLLQYVL